MPTGRAPTPILRKVAAEVPTRWPPSDVWARAGTGAPSAKAATRRRAPGLEVIIDSRAPLRAGQVVRRVAEHADQQRFARRFARQPGQLLFREQSLAGLVAVSGQRIDAARDLGVEDVGAGEREIETVAAAQPEFL